MSRWRVRKTTSGFVILFGEPKWEVRKPDGGLALKRFRTHAEAMAAADRLARTVEVTLPRAHALPTKRHTVQKNGLVIEFERSRSYPQLQPSYLVVEPDERRPLALALLALAEKEEVERP